MCALLRPHLIYETLDAVPPDELLRRGVRLVLLDIDNTLAPYTRQTAGDVLRAWAEAMRGAGLTLYLLSNNKGTRPETFAAELDLPYLKRAKKPSPEAARSIMAELNVSPKETAIVGDQIYTDMLCAHRCGCLAVLIEPIELHNIWLRLRYWAERPFRRVHS